MASLAILQRSDGNLALITATDNAAALARRLATMQPFEVEVFAEFPGKAMLLPMVQNMLQTQHRANGWHAASAAELLQAVCQVCAAQPEQEQQVHDAIMEETAQETSEEEVGAQDSQRIDPNWHALLVPCARENADKATTIRRTLKALLGRWQTEAVLSAYKETCLRIGPCGRYIVNEKGETLRLAAKATKPSVTPS